MSAASAIWSATAGTRRRKTFPKRWPGAAREALAATAELRKSHPSSRWLDDARALEIEIKQAGGKPVSPESADDEELKLMALNSFMNSDPERALPLLENFPAIANKLRTLQDVGLGYIELGQSATNSRRFARSSVPPWCLGLTWCTCTSSPLSRA